MAGNVGQRILGKRNRNTFYNSSLFSPNFVIPNFAQHTLFVHVVMQ